MRREGVARVIAPLPAEDHTQLSSDVIRWTEDSSYLDICMDRNTADQALALLQLKSVVHNSIFCEEENCLGWAGVNDDGEGGRY